MLGLDRGFQYKPPTMQSDDYIHLTNLGETRVIQGSTYSQVSIELRVPRPIINAIVKNVLPILLITVGEDLPTVEYLTLLDTLYPYAYVYGIAVMALLIYITKLGHEDTTDMAASVKADRWGGGLSLGVYLMASGLVIALALLVWPD